jgi:diguanylate cyclase (GGDEF)-like protein
LLFFLFFASIFSIHTIEGIGAKNIKEIIASNIYEHRKKELNLVLAQKRKFLLSFAKYLATNSQIIKGYLQNNRNEIIRLVLPLWESLREKDFIYEIHFFKRPAISYINFANLSSYGIDVSDVRIDIEAIATSFRPSFHFLVCRTFPGVRATYPIIYKDKLLGSISVGIKIETIADYFRKLDAKNVFLALNDKLLKRSLRKEIYQDYRKNGILKNGFIFTGDIDSNVVFSKKSKIFSSNKIYSKFVLKDFNSNVLGYIIVEDELEKISFQLHRFIWQKNLLFDMLAFVYSFIILIVLYLIFKKIDMINKISYLIKEKNFAFLPPKKKPSSKIDELQNNLVDAAKELEKHINLLTKEIENYKDKAYIDALTGAFNRRFLEEYGKILFEKSKLTKTSFVLLMCDLDNFKKANDTFGHDFGDFVLQETIRIVKNNLRENDIVIRYGGEEFVFILQNITIKNGYKIAEKILQSIANHHFKIGEKEAKTTISIGISEIHKNDKNLSDIIKRADKKLYVAKKNGKNRIEI